MPNTVTPTPATSPTAQDLVDGAAADARAARLERIARAARQRRHIEDGVRARLAGETDREAHDIAGDVDRLAEVRMTARILEAGATLLGQGEDHGAVVAALPYLLEEVSQERGISLPALKGAVAGAVALANALAPDPE